MNILSRWTILFSLSSISFVAGCAKAPHARPGHVDAGPLPAAVEISAWSSIDSGSYRQQLAKLGTLPNIGLQLPVASPNGRWIAVLAAPDVEAVDPDALLSGRSLNASSLMLFDIAHPLAPARLISPGAAWPVWSSDSRQLYGVAYDKAGHCGLIIHDLLTAKTRRLEVGLNHIVEPALSPSGTTLAFAAYSDIPQQAKLYTYQIGREQLTPLSTPRDMLWQLMPIWINDHALLYYGRTSKETGLFGTALAGSSRDAQLANLTLPPLAADAIRSQSGISRPRSTDGNRLATFDSSISRISISRLDDARPLPLEPMSQAGLWAGDDRMARFIYTTDKELHIQTTRGEPLALATQPFLPLWCSPGGGTFLLLSPGQSRWTFDLIRMRIEPTPK